MSKNKKRSKVKEDLVDWIGTLNDISENPTTENKALLKRIFFTRELCVQEKFSFSKYAARIFLCFGKPGIDDLVEIFQKDETSPKHTNAILGTLFFASKKQYFDPNVTPSEKKRLKKPQITDELAKYAEIKTFDLISICINTPDLFDKVIDFFKFCQMPRQDCNYDELKTELFSLLRDSTLQINGIIIENFKRIIENDSLKEEVYQEFLCKNPVLMDPLAKKIIPKQQLGNEYITDFVIKKFDDEYILVEIEKPRNKIFTKKNDFSADLTHAIGQVIDFQEWVESDIHYAQRLLPNISSPNGIVIIGRSKDLTVVQKTKLKRLNISFNKRLTVYTYDDILENASKLFNNVISHG
jgi:hypothetical protein